LIKPPETRLVSWDIAPTRAAACAAGQVPVR
jgi:hypothetical protein